MGTDDPVGHLDRDPTWCVAPQRDGEHLGAQAGHPQPTVDVRRQHRVVVTAGL
jgi:hypothetical protein